MSNHAKFDSLREIFDSFCYQGFHYSVENGDFFAKYDFVLSPRHFERGETAQRNPGQIEFHPRFRIPARPFYRWDEIPKPLLDKLVFHIGMIEMISYWKIACPKKVVVKPFALDEEQIKWWKKLYFNGLGEFFYVNGIQTNINDFMTVGFDTSFRAERSAVEKSQKINETPSLFAVSRNDLHTPSFRAERSAVEKSHLNERVLIPVGGGKDSVVTLELLKNRIAAIPLIINPREATAQCVAAAGFTKEQTSIIMRSLDPTMLKMNAEGYLNGHTPFSALLAFYAILLGFATQSRYIALSNESSANEPTVPDTEINHQYSKSIAFENDFRHYVSKYVNADIQYFSFLRPLNELQIAKLFSRAKDYHKAFKSCNVGSKTDSWCGKCPKCLFTWLALSPFISRKELIRIFNKDLLKDNDLRPILDQLDGSVEVKPFECVGTVGEVRACVNNILQHDDNLKDTILNGIEKTDVPTVKDFMTQFDDDNNLPELFENILKEGLDV